MGNWSELFSYLGDDDAHWLLLSGEELTISSGEVLIEEGMHIDRLFLVVKGLFKITTKLSRGYVFGVRGPGEILGELSFIDHEPTSATSTTSPIVR